MFKHFEYQEARLGVAVAWILAPIWGVGAGFYLGTIWATPSVIDLRIRDLQWAVGPALIGLCLGLVFAIAVTVFYPPIVARQYKQEAADAHH